MYPTLLGYALGAIATGFLVGASSWPVRMLPALVCALVFTQCLREYEHFPFMVLMTFAAGTGICCTYVQVLSWQLAFAHVREGKKRAQRLRTNKVQKVE